MANCSALISRQLFPRPHRHAVAAAASSSKQQWQRRRWQHITYRRGTRATCLNFSVTFSPHFPPVTVASFVPNKCMKWVWDSEDVCYCSCLEPVFHFPTRFEQEVPEKMQLCATRFYNLRSNLTWVTSTLRQHFGHWIMSIVANWASCLDFLFKCSNSAI